MSSHGRLILKLTEARATELIAAGTGAQFYPSPDRPLKGWIEVTGPEADLIALAHEANQIAVARPSKGRSRG